METLKPLASLRSLACSVFDFSEVAAFKCGSEGELGNELEEFCSIASYNTLDPLRVIADPETPERQDTIFHAHFQSAISGDRGRGAPQCDRQSPPPARSRHQLCLFPLFRLAFDQFSVQKQSR